MSSQILELNIKTWRDEIENTRFPAKTKRLLVLAILAKNAEKNVSGYPKLSDEEFDEIVFNDVFMIRFKLESGTKQLLLEKRNDRNNRHLFLRYET
jgi:hypothetical protein